MSIFYVHPLFMIIRVKFYGFVEDKNIGYEMKGKFSVIVLSLAVASGSVFAQGFSGPNQGVSTVKQVLDSGVFSDDMPVTLTGKIKSSLGGEQYLFEDSTGEVIVDIDHDKWVGQSVTPSSTVELRGEVDKNISGVKVDVDVIKVL